MNSSPAPSTLDVVQTERAANSIALVTPVLILLNAALAIAFAFTPGAQRSAVFVGCFACAGIVGYTANRLGHNRIAAVLLVSVLVLAPALEPLVTGDISTNLAFVGITAVLALMLIEWRYRWWLFTAVTAIGVVTLARTDPALTAPVGRTAMAVSGVGLLIFSLVTGMWLLRSYRTMIEHAASAQRLAEAKARDVSELNEVLAAAVSAREAELAEAIEAQRILAEQLAESTVRDPLTGLLNRRYLDQHRDQWDGAAAVALLDVDHFKRFNDTYSYEVGDQVLIGIARTLRRRVSAPAVLIRHGGEEFLVVFPRECENVLDSVEDLRGSIAAMTWDHLKPGLEVTVSVGLCLADDESANSPGRLTSMIRCADQALAEAKGQGRNRTFVVSCRPPSAI